MSVKVVRRGLVLGAALAGLVLTGSASAAVIRGVVVSHNARAHSFVVAERKGKLVSVHSRRSPALGRVVSVRAKELLNGTFAAKHIRVHRQLKHRVLINGVVTFVNQPKHEFTVSAAGASLLVHRGQAANAAADVAASDPLPSVGDDVTVETEIGDQGDLEDQGDQTTGTETQNVDVEGTVLSIDTTANTVTISADGEDDTTQSITISVPSTLDISAFSVGQEVELTVAVQPDGSLVLQGSSDDGDSQQADDSGDQQGCQGDGEDDSCSQSGDGSSTQDGDTSGGDGSSTQGGDSSGGDGSSTQGGDTSGSSEGSDTSGSSEGGDTSGSTGSDTSGSGSSGSDTSGSDSSGSDSSGSDSSGSSGSGSDG